MNENPSSERRYYRRPSLFWPIALIGAGVIFLLYNLGYLKTDPWPLLFQLWPVVLIVIGLDILLGRRSILGGVLSAVFALLLIGGVVALLLTAQNYPGLIKAGTPELRVEHIAQPLDQARRAEAAINFAGGAGYIVALQDSSNLIEGDLRYYGSLDKTISASGDTARIELGSRGRGFIFDSTWWENNQERWTLGLNPRVEYDLRLAAGSGSYEFDLRQFKLSAFELEAGSGAIRLTLPETGQYRAKIEAGSGSLDIHVPEGVAVRVEYDAGAGSLDAPGLTRVSGGRDGVYESAGFSQNGHYVIIRLEGGSGSVTLR